MLLVLLQYPDGGPLFLEATLRSDAPVGPLPSFKKPAASGDFLGTKTHHQFQSLPKFIEVADCQGYHGSSYTFFFFFVEIP